MAPSRCLYLSEIGVDERRRQAGIGSAMISELLAESCKGYDSILVRTLSHVFGANTENPAISFYQKSGFDRVMNDGQVLVEDKGRFAARPRVFLSW